MFVAYSKTEFPLLLFIAKDLTVAASEGFLQSAFGEPNILICEHRKKPYNKLEHLFTVFFAP